MLDRSSGRLVFVQLKWHDAYGFGLAERASRQENLLKNGNEWVDKVHSWIAGRTSQEISATYGWGDASEDMRTASMIFSLVIAASYAVLGIWAGKRFLILAVTVLLAACLGWWLFPNWLYAFLALGVGGVLILAGAWLPRP